MKPKKKTVLNAIFVLITALGYTVIKVMELPTEEPNKAKDKARNSH